MNSVDLTMRALRYEDATAVAALMSEHWLWGSRDQEQQRSSIAYQLEHGDYGSIAEWYEHDVPILVGFVLMSDGTFGDHGYIRLIGTRQKFTGRGIGSRLLGEAERVFRARGIRRVFLLCTDWNTGAQAFYERHGYSRVGALPDWLIEGVDELIYVKRDLGDDDRDVKREEGRDW